MLWPAIFLCITGCLIFKSGLELLPWERNRGTIPKISGSGHTNPWVLLKSPFAVPEQPPSSGETCSTVVASESPDYQYSATCNRQPRAFEIRKVFVYDGVFYIRSSSLGSPLQIIHQYENDSKLCSITMHRYFLIRLVIWHREAVR